jgi:xanthine dehydrogenase large subunit
VSIELFDRPNREETIHRSKAVGEPPLMLAMSVFYAIRDAVAACAPAATLPDLPAPATPEAVLTAIERVRRQAVAAAPAAADTA